MKPKLLQRLGLTIAIPATTFLSGCEPAYQKEFQNLAYGTLGPEETLTIDFLDDFSFHGEGINPLLSDLKKFYGDKELSKKDVNNIASKLKGYKLSQ